MFGNHEPVSTSTKGPQSPMAVFTSGLQLVEGRQWKFRFDNGFIASLAVGPSVRGAQVNQTAFGAQTSGLNVNVGIKGLATVGVAF